MHARGDEQASSVALQPLLMALEDRRVRVPAELLLRPSDPALCVVHAGAEVATETRPVLPATGHLLLPILEHLQPAWRMSQQNLNTTLGPAAQNSWPCAETTCSAGNNKLGIL